MADFEYNPVAGWEDETIFPDYPTAPEVRPLFQRLFNQIRDAFNLTKNDYETHKADISTAHGIGNKLDKSGGTMSGELNCADNLLTRPYIKDYAEVLGTTPSTTGAVTFDLATGNTFNLSPTGACTLAITNPPATGRVGSFTLMINMPATLYAMTYPASFRWDKGTIPTLVISKMAVITGFTIDAGVTWHVGAFGTEF
jgi:hypothetical protein